MTEKLRVAGGGVNRPAETVAPAFGGNGVQNFFVKFFSFILKNKIQIFACRKMTRFLISSPLPGREGWWV